MVLKADCDDLLTTFVDHSLENAFKKRRKCHSAMLLKFQNAVFLASNDLQ